MRVLSLHNCAKFGCFISINDKIVNNLLGWGRFRPNFRRSSRQNYGWEPKKFLYLKWWHGPGPPLSPCKIWWKSRDARRRERMKCDVVHFFVSYRQYLPDRRAALSVLLLLTGRFSGFSPHRGDTLHRSKWNLAGRGPLFPTKFHLDRLRGRGLRPPKLKKWNFTNIIAPKCGSLGYMCVLSLDEFAKFGCFILTNSKIINNFNGNAAGHRVALSTMTRQ